MVRISLFGLAGTGTSSVGKELAKQLDLEFKSSGDMFRELAKKYDMDLYSFGKYCEENPDVDKKLDRKITQFGEENDYFVFDSRLAWYTIPHSFKVKLICKEDTRINRIIEREGGNFDELKEKTLKREKSEALRYKSYYNIKNYQDDDHFDLVIDTTNISIDKVCEIIIDSLE